MVIAMMLLLILVPVTLATMRSGSKEEPPKGEPRTKTLAYYADSNRKISLHWVDEELNALRKATDEEIEQCKKLRPEEKIPICKTTYYDEGG